jgi:predicted DNA-binding protein with PD1-like motif
MLRLAELNRLRSRCNWSNPRPTQPAKCHVAKAAFGPAGNIKATSFVALGAFERAIIAYFEWDEKKYEPIPIEQQAQVIALAGDVVPNQQDEPDLHAHCVLGLPDGSTRGGHLVKGAVRPTPAVTITETRHTLFAISVAALVSRSSTLHEQRAFGCRCCGAAARLGLSASESYEAKVVGLSANRAPALPTFKITPRRN